MGVIEPSPVENNDQLPPSYEEATASGPAACGPPPLLADSKTYSQSRSHPDSDTQGLSHQLAATPISESDSDASSTVTARSSSAATLVNSLPPDYPTSAEPLLSQAYSALHQSAPLAPPYSALPPLPKPIAIPQLTRKTMPPYARAYPPILSSFGISTEVFLNFIDTLNVLTTENPALRLLGVAGDITSQVPVNVAQLAGSAAQATAAASAHILSATLGDRYVRRANAEIFHPRRLHVQVASARTLRMLAGVPASLPLAAPVAVETVTASILERRMGAMGAWVSELQIRDLPPPAAQASMLARMSERQVRTETERAERMAIKRRVKALAKHPPADVDAAAVAQALRQTGDRRLEKHADKVERRLEKRVGRDERKRQRLFERADKKVQRALDKGKAVDIGAIESQRDEKLMRLEHRLEKRSPNGENAPLSPQSSKMDREEKAAEKAKWLVITQWDGREEEVGLLKRIMSGGSGSSNGRIASLDTDTLASGSGSSPVTPAERSRGKAGDPDVIR